MPWWRTHGASSCLSPCSAPGAGGDAAIQGEQRQAGGADGLGPAPGAEAGACPSWRSSGDQCPLAGQDRQPGGGGWVRVWSAGGPPQRRAGFPHSLALGCLRLRAGCPTCPALPPAAGAQCIPWRLSLLPGLWLAVGLPPPAPRTKASSPGKLLIWLWGQECFLPAKLRVRGSQKAGFEVSCCPSRWQWAGQREGRDRSLCLAPVA